MSRLSKFFSALVLVAGMLSMPAHLFARTAADPNAPENFWMPKITSGMSAQDQESVQSIQQLIAGHRSAKKGDMNDAYRIQVMLAQYWANHNQSAFAMLCLKRAQAAKLRAQQTASTSPSQQQPPGIAPDSSDAAPQPGSAPSAGPADALNGTYGTASGQQYPAYPTANSADSSGAQPVLPPAPPASGASDGGSVYPAYPAPNSADSGAQPVLPPASTNDGSPQPPTSPATAPTETPTEAGKDSKIKKVNRFLDKLAVALNAAADQANANGLQPGYPSTAPDTSVPSNGSTYPAYPAAPNGTDPAAVQPVYPPASPAPGGSAYVSSDPSQPVPYPAAASPVTPATASSATYGASNSSTSPGNTFRVNRRYYAMVNGALEKWDFNHDGTFLYEGVVAAVGTSVGNSGRGTYQIQGNVLLLRTTKTASAFATPGVSSNGSNTQLGGSSNTNATTRQMTIQLIGPDGLNGVVLNGTRFNVRHWE